MAKYRHYGVSNFELADCAHRQLLRYLTLLQNCLAVQEETAQQHAQGEAVAVQEHLQHAQILVLMPTVLLFCAAHSA